MHCNFFLKDNALYLSKEKLHFSYAIPLFNMTLYKRSIPKTMSWLNPIRLSVYNVVDYALTTQWLVLQEASPRLGSWAKQKEICGSSLYNLVMNEG